MCGILFLASGLDVLACDSGERSSGPDAAPSAPQSYEFEEGLRCRGPDAHNSFSISCGAARLHFEGSVLQLRGMAPSSSPLRDAATGNVLLFNGQIFGGLEVPALHNDAQMLLQALSQPGADVVAVLTALRGPWALVFWQHATRTLWFGRDPIGRRSLLLHLPCPGDGRLMLTSLAPLDPAIPFRGFAELPPGINSLQLPSSDTAGSTVSDLAAGLANGSSSRLAAVHRRHDWADPAVKLLAEFRRHPQLVHPPEHAQPASANTGGEALAPATVPAPVAQPAAREGQPAAAAEQSRAAGGSVDLPAAWQQEASFEQAVHSVLQALRHAVVLRCRCIEDRQQQQAVKAPRGSAAAAASQEAPRNGFLAPRLLLPAAPVLILFSGGVDSTLLAALAHEAVPPGVPIDLASICFNGGSSPDRLAALDALEELRGIAPGRCWRLIKVDCQLADLEAHRPRLLRLLAPADTVMDLNIGAALWLAARGEGVLHAQEGAGDGLAGLGTEGRPTADQQVQQGTAAQQQQQQQEAGTQAGGGASGAHSPVSTPQQVRSAARVVLLGHGADELCGGYGRHRTAFRARGWQGLDEELALDMRRLWLRNLGRDDRLVADHGREARHAFLDEGVVAAVLATPLQQVADLRLPPGQGDKRLLRACLEQLGLPRVATRVKRAIQFGTRLARLTNAAEFGGTRRANLRNAGSVRLSDV